MKAFWWCLRVGFVAVGLPLMGQTTFNDVAGTWFYGGLQIGRQPQRDGQNNITGLEVGYDSSRVVVTHTGAYQETVLGSSYPDNPPGQVNNGQLTLGAEKNLGVQGDPDYAFFFNSNRDIFFTFSSEGTGPDTEVSLALALRSPATLTLPALAGNWVYQSIRADSRWGTVNADLDIPLTLNADGTGAITFPEEGRQTFTASIVEGRLKVVPEGVEEDIRFAVNAAQDVMARFTSFSDGPEEIEASMEILIRPPASLVLGDLVGLWIVHSFDADLRWTLLNPNPQENPDFQPHGNLNDANYENIRVLVQPNGQYVGWVVRPGFDQVDLRMADQFRGTVDVDPETGRPRLFVTDNGIFALLFQINASKNFMVLVQEERPEENNTDGNTNLVIAVKKPASDRSLFSEVPGYLAGWRRLDWFGQFYANGNGPGWILHEVHGWIHVSGSSLSGFWVFFPGFNIDGGAAGSFLWTGQAIYPYFLRQNGGSVNPFAGFSWVYFDQAFWGQTGQRWFGDLSTNPVTWVQEAPVLPVP